MSEQIAQQCDDCVCLFSCCVSGKVQHVRPCPLHKSAPALLEALEELIAVAGPALGPNDTLDESRRIARLAKGEN